MLIVPVRVSIVVSISACHADDPGSIPGRGTLFLTYAFHARIGYAETKLRREGELNVDSSRPR